MQIDINDPPAAMTKASYAPESQTERRGGTIAKEDTSDTEPSVIDELREKGFLTYLKELEEKKKEEIREKILQAMGLSEEDLAAMSPEQRGVIEDIITEEIKRRIMAQAVVNDNDAAPKSGETSNPSITGDIQNGMTDGLTLIAAMEHTEKTAPNTNEPEDR